MSYIHFKLNPDGTTGSVMAYDSDPGIATDSENVVLEYDYDPSTEFISALGLSEDKTSVVNKYPGQTLDEQKASFDADQKVEQLSCEKNRLRARIKSLVADLIEPLENDEKKAKEVDATNGNTNKQREIAIYRRSVRSANNAHEQLLDAITDVEDIYNFDPDWTKTFTETKPSI